MPRSGKPVCGDRIVSARDHDGRHGHRPHPRETATRTTLFGHFAEPLSSSAGAFPWDKPDITRQCFAISKPICRSQRRDRPHAGMSHQPPRSGTLASLLGHELGQLVDLGFPLFVHLLQHAPPDMRCVAATARTRSSLARRGSTNQDLLKF